MDRPDRLGRAQILAIHVKNVVLAPAVRLAEVAALTPGFTGADLANLVNEAALVATRRSAERAELESKMAVLLGGRAAEELVFAQLSTGAADDLSKVTEIARSMVTRYGMFPGLGPLAYETEPSSFLAGIPQAPRRMYSEQTAREIDLAILGLVEAAHARARRLLEANRGLLEEGARQLLDQETLADAELQVLFRQVTIPSRSRSALPRWREGPPSRRGGW